MMRNGARNACVLNCTDVVYMGRPFPSLSSHCTKYNTSYNSRSQIDLTFIYSPGFVREWNRQRLTDADLVALEEEIGRAPGSAPVMRGAGGLRKIRFSPPSGRTGKSGAMRVGFAYFQVKAAIIVVSIFAENEAANFTAAERAQIAKWIKRVEEEFR